MKLCPLRGLPEVLIQPLSDVLAKHGCAGAGHGDPPAFMGGLLKVSAHHLGFPDDPNGLLFSPQRTINSK